MTGNILQNTRQSQFNKQKVKINAIFPAKGHIIQVIARSIH